MILSRRDQMSFRQDGSIIEKSPTESREKTEYFIPFSFDTMGNRENVLGASLAAALAATSPLTAQENQVEDHGLDLDRVQEIKPLDTASEELRAFAEDVRKASGGELYNEDFVKSGKYRVVTAYRGQPVEVHFDLNADQGEIIFYSADDSDKLTVHKGSISRQELIDASQKTNKSQNPYGIWSMDQDDLLQLLTKAGFRPPIPATGGPLLEGEPEMLTLDFQDITPDCDEKKGKDKFACKLEPRKYEKKETRYAVLALEQEIAEQAQEGQKLDVDIAEQAKIEAQIDQENSEQAQKGDELDREHEQDKLEKAALRALLRASQGGS
jgi:hypothetical protein